MRGGPCFGSFGKLCPALSILFIIPSHMACTSGNVLPCVERRTLSRDILIVYTFEDLLLPIYKNFLDLLLFCILFSTTILINIKITVALVILSLASLTLLLAALAIFPV